MIIENPVFTNFKKTHVSVIIDGVMMVVGAVAGNKEYDAILAAGPIADHTAPSITTADIGAECRRRILLIASIEKQLNMDRRLRELSKLEALGQDMTGYQTEINLINDKFTEIDRLRDQSNTLESAPPADYTADTHW